MFTVVLLLAVIAFCLYMVRTSPLVGASSKRGIEIFTIVVIVVTVILCVIMLIRGVNWNKAKVDLGGTPVIENFAPSV